MNTRITRVATSRTCDPPDGQRFGPGHGSRCPCRAVQTSLHHPTFVGVVTTDQVGLAALPFKSGSFDLVVLMFAAHEVRDPAARVCFFGELRRILADGGKLSGVATRVLTLSNVTVANTGTYSVIVSNALGSVVTIRCAKPAAIATIVIAPANRTTSIGSARHPNPVSS